MTISAPPVASASVAGRPSTGSNASRTTGFARAFSAELIKLRSIRSTGVLLVAAALGVLLIGAANAAGIAVQAVQGVDPSTADGPASDPATAALSGVGSALVVVAALGVLSVTSDYASGMVRTTIAAVPRRGQLVVGKAAALVVLVLPVMLGAVLLTALATYLIVSVAGLSLPLGQPGLIRALVGAALYLAVLAVFAAGLGWLLRSTAGALATWLGLWVLPTFLLMLLPAPVAQRVQPWLPGNAGTAVYQVGGISEPAAWASLGAFAAYALVITIVAAAVLHSRDA